MSQEENFTFEDLRDRLYSSLRQTGTVDSLKSQLRNRLVTELKKLGVRDDAITKPVTGDAGSLMLTATNSLVADHLRRCHYDYTHSVFLPECALSESKIFTTKDLLQLLKISPHSSLYKNLSLHAGDSYHEKGFLWKLLSEIANMHGQTSQDNGVQTDEIGLPPLHSLHEKLRLVDDYYSVHGEGVSSQMSGIQDRMLSYQRMVDQRSQSEVQLQVARFKDSELARLRLEEKETFNEKLQAARKEMERDYKVKYDALLQRERNAMERLQKQQELAEKDVYTQRQSILSEIEAVRQRETELRRQQEMLEREKMMLEDRMKTKEESVRRREDTVRKTEMEYENRLHSEMSKFQMETQSNYLQRYKDLEWREMKAKEDGRRLDEELMDIHKVKEELRDKRMKVTQLDAELQHCRKDMLAAQHQADLLGQKTREMVDYQTLKEENLLLKQELNQIKIQLAESQKDLNLERQRYENLLRETGERQNRPTAEVLILQRELEKAKSQLRQEQVISDHLKAQMDTKALDERGRTRDVVHRFEEVNLQHREMNQEMDMLRQQLASTRQALTNEVYKNTGSPKSMFASQRLSNFGPIGIYDQPWQIYEPSFNTPTSKPNNRDYYERSRTPSPIDIDEVFQTPTKPSREKEISISDTDIVIPKSDEDTAGVSQSEDYSYSLDIVTDTKNRLKNLEREAQNLEENYRNFQFRMTNVHAALPIASPKQQNIAERSPIVKEKLSTPLRTSLFNSQMSSTPQKPSVSIREGGVGETTPSGEPPMNLTVSSVHTSPEKPAIHSSVTIRETRSLKVDDLNIRSESTSAAVLPSYERRSPPGQSEVSDEAAAASAPQSATHLPPSTAYVPVSLDSAWSTKNVEDEEAEKRREEEEKLEEEGRQARQEERRRKQEAAWEREQEELRKLRGENSQSDEKSKEKPETGEPAIDPVMQKYMDMLKQQKEKEKQVTQKAVDVWSKGHIKNNDEDGLVSDEDISAAHDKSESQASQGKKSDGIFDDW